MCEIQRMSLAEFSRLYLRSLDKVDHPSTLPAPVHIPENGFAIQVVLGMSKNIRKSLTGDHTVS